MNSLEEITLYPSKTKYLCFLFFSFAFTVAGIWLVYQAIWIGYLCAAFFGLGIPIFIIVMLPGAAYLRLGREGFEFASLFRKTFVKWSDIKALGVVAMAPACKMVCLDFADDYDRYQVGRSISRHLAGMEGGLPDTYGMKAEDLLALMVEYWNQYKQIEPAREADEAYESSHG